MVCAGEGDLGKPSVAKLLFIKEAMPLWLRESSRCRSIVSQIFMVHSIWYVLIHGAM